MYTQADFVNDCRSVFNNTEGNIVEIPSIGYTILYDMPLIGFASASDELFETFRRREIIGPRFFGPAEWLPTAKTVVSFFLPFSNAVRKSNRDSKTDPSVEWLYGRIEGQDFISRFLTALKRLFEEKSINVCVPCLDERFDVKYEKTSTEDGFDFHVDSRWSERHAAYACGLGTFGLSRGLISEKGIAGRYGSLIVSEKWGATGRSYTGIDDYCIRCGACVRNCPAQAISLEHGKNNIRCNAHVEKIKEKYSPRYGCGKCQVGVPCESRAPGRK
jgi:epoxyqueuosine reductase QueG